MQRANNQAHNGRSHKPSRDRSRKPISRRSSVSPQWMRDFLSEMLAVEMGGIKLYQKALDDLKHAELEQKLSEFLEQTERHADLCKEMLNAVCDDPDYVSPGAETAEQKAEGLLTADAVPEMSDLNNLENLVLAETKDHWNWEMLAAVATKIEDRELKGLVQKAIREVRKQEKMHVDWNVKALTKVAIEFSMQPQDDLESSEDSEDIQDQE